MSLLTSVFFKTNLTACSLFLTNVYVTHINLPYFTPYGFLLFITNTPKHF